MHKIGVFDSGIGGLSVAKTIQQAFPKDEVIFANDQTNMPYGNKKPQQVLKFVEPILKDLVQEGCEVIVVACNTVTTTLISKLRERIKVPIVGMEPMVKPAASTTRTQVIAVCATPATLASKRYAWLKETFAKNVKVLEPDCSQWASMVEHNQIDEGKIAQQINNVCNQGADVIVLGCTHYHWIEELIQSIAAQRAVVVQPEQPVVKQLKTIISTL